MTLLGEAAVALVTEGAAWSEAVAVALEAAGAEVRRCAPDRDLWAVIAGGAFDAIVLADVEGLGGVARALREEARTRDVPALVVRGEGGAHDDVGLPVIAALDAVPAVASSIRVKAARISSMRPPAQPTLGAIVHDVRVLLGIVMGFACNLRDEVAGPLAEAQREHVRKILDAATDAGKLLEEASAAASRENTRVPVPGRASRRALLDLVDLARGVTHLFEKVAADRDMRVELVAPDSVHLWGDAMQLKQVMTNLLVNALKFTPRGGRVVVRVGLSAGAGEGVSARKMAELRVSDTGPGVPHEERERIFERHVRLARDTHVPGSGIGLAVVREIVLQHGGKARVEDAAEGGAEMIVTLPLDLRRRARDEAAS